MASERTVYVKVGAKVDGAVAGLRKVNSAVSDLTKADLQKPKKAFDDLSNKSALLGGAVLLGVGKAVSSFADFDQAMSGVAANSGATGKELDALRDKAMQLGADTQFSATEAAQGINELAKAGVSSQEILNGGLKGALDLAAAGQIGVAQAAETTASALNQFEQDGSQATHVADLLSNAANAAQGGVGDMGMALNQAGVAAHAAGLNIDETTTLLALFAKAGMTGSDAGTSLKTMMQRLSAPTEKAAATMEELGISAYDAQGKFVGAQALIGQLSDATKDLSTESKMAAFNTIFGADAIRAASIAAAAGADGYAKMNAEVMKTGGAAENAAKLTDNLKGDIERLGGSIDTAFISAGSAANGGLRDLTKGLGVAVDVIGRLPGPLVLATTGFAGLALTVPKGLSVFRNFTSELDTMGLSLDKISAKAPRTARALGLLKSAGVIAGVAAVSVAIQEAGAASEVATVSVDKLTESLSGLSGPGQLQGGIADLFRDNGGLLKSREEFVSTSEAIERFNQTAFDALSDGNLAKLVRAAQPGAEAKLDKYVTQIDTALAQMVSSGNADQAKASLDALIAGIDDPQVAEAARARFTEYAEAVKTVGVESKDAAPKIGETSDAVKDVEQKADDAKKALDALTDTIEGFGSPLAAQRAAQRDFQDSINGAKDALKSQREELIKTRTEQVKAGLGKVSTGPTQSSKDSVAKAALRQQQAEQRLAAVQAKGAKATAKELQSARQAVERSNQALEQARGRMSSSGSTKAAELTAKQKRDIEAWADAQLKAGAALDTTTDAGMKNQAALDGIRDKALKAATATFKLTGSADLAAQEVQRGRDAFIKAATDMGLGADKAKQLADNMGLIPKDVKTQVGLSGVPDTEAKLDAITGKVTELDQKKAKPEVKPFINTSNADVIELRLDQLARQRSAFISIDAGLTAASFGLFSSIGGIGKLAISAVKKKATGGPIYGPGTGTSDTAGIYALSNNEHVLTAAEVAAAGGHGAIFALRKAILSGGVQFRAAGGPAVPASAYRAAPPAPFRFDAASLSQRGGDTINMHAYGLDVDAALKRNVRDLFWERDRRR